MDLQGRLDTRVTIVGTAQNASRGAIVLTDDRTPVYVDGLERWDRSTDGKQVSATGMLRRRAGEAVVNERGESSHGIPSDRFVLEEASWSVS